MRLKNGYKPPRLRISTKNEGPTWPEDTEIMISRALTLKKDRGDEGTCP